MNYETKVTRKLRAVNPNLTVTTCVESDCQTTILVDKDEMGRVNRCVACAMRMKLNGK